MVHSGQTSVTKLRAIDGARLGTFDVGIAQAGIVFDGANMWVTHSGGRIGATVTKLQASDGTVLGTFAVGTDPRGLAFDGANIWVANHGSDTLTKLRASDGALLATTALKHTEKTVDPTGNVRITNLTFTQPYGVAFDGKAIWVSCPGNNYVIRE